MTSDEALEVLGYLLGHEKAVDSGELGDVQNSLNSQEQEALKVILSEFRELKEKATAKKPKKIKRHRGGFEMEHCPNCDTDYQVDRRFEVEEDYCGNCGKLLDSSFINFCANCGCPVDMSKGKE